MQKSGIGTIGEISSFGSDLNPCVRASQNGNWQASAWMLERIFPGSFSANQVNSAEDDKIEVVNDVPKM